jgi:hypothetical protein
MGHHNAVLGNRPSENAVVWPSQSIGLFHIHNIVTRLAKGLDNTRGDIFIGEEP